MDRQQVGDIRPSSFDQNPEATSWRGSSWVVSSSIGRQRSTCTAPRLISRAPSCVRATCWWLVVHDMDRLARYLFLERPRSCTGGGSIFHRARRAFLQPAPRADPAQGGAGSGPGAGRIGGPSTLLLGAFATEGAASFAL
jgi:hypothetical protein